MGAFADFIQGGGGEQVAPEPLSEYSKSLRAGAYGAGSAIHSAAGLVGEALGFNDFAKNRNAAAAALQAQVQANAPRIGSYKQVLDSPDFSTGLRNAGDYVTGLVGSSLPVMGAGLVGGLIGGVGGGAAAAGRAIAGSAAATLPFNVGDVAQKQMADPEAMRAPAGMRLRDAVMGGAGASLIEGVVPGMVAGKILGRGAKQATRQTLRQTVGHNLASIPIEGGAEGSGEAIKQYAANQDKPLDAEAIKESIVGGAAAGGVFAGVGTAADVVHGKASAVGDVARSATSYVGDKVSKVVDRTKSTAGTMQADAPKKFKTVSEEFSDLVARGREYADESIDKIMTGQPLVDAQTFATEAGQKISDDARVQKATEWASKMANDAGLTPERRQQAVELAQTVSTEAGQIAAATAKKTYDAGMTAAVKINNLYDSLADKVNEQVDLFRAGKAAQEEANGIKQSADYSGVSKAIADRLGPLIAANPGLVDRPGDVAKLADSMRLVATKMRDGELSPETETMLSSIFGLDAPEAVRRSFEVTGNTNKIEVERFYAEYNKFAARRKRSAALEKTIFESLTSESRNLIKPKELPEFVQMLIRHASGADTDPKMGPQQRLAKNEAFRNTLDGLFEGNTDAVLASVEAEADMRFEADNNARVGRQNTSDDLSEIDDLDGVDFAERSMGVEKDNDPADAKDVKDYVSVRRFGHNAAGRMAEEGEAVMVPDVFTRKARYEGLTGKNHGAQLLLDARNKYADSTHNVYFKRDSKNSDTGHVVVETLNDPEDFTDRDLDAMRLDQNYSNSPDKIVIKGRAYDSKRIASAMEDKVPYSKEDQPRAERLAELFSAGAARLMAQFGEFSIPDTAVIGRVGGKDFTFGDAKKLDRRTNDDKNTDAATQTLNSLRKQYLQATGKPERLAKLGLERVELSPAQIEGLIEAARILGNGFDYLKSRELSASGNSDSANLTPRAEAMRRLEKDHQRHVEAIAAKGVPRDKIKAKTDMGDRPFEDQNTRFDREGNLTRSGALELLEGESRYTIGKDENIHRVATALKKDDSMVVWSNMDGSPNSKSSTDSEKLNTKPARTLMHRMRDSETAIGRKLANRLSTLLDNAQAMSDKDRVRLSRLGVGMKPSEAAAVINPLAMKYKDVIVAPGVKSESVKVKGDSASLAGKVSEAPDAADSTPSISVAQRIKNDEFSDLDTVGKVDKFLNDAYEIYKNGTGGAALQANLNRMFDEHAWAATDLAGFYDGLKGGNAELDHEELLQGFKARSAPSPKSLAAKKAALLEAASSSDPALLKELSTTSDARALQRTVAELPPGAAADTANTRMAELVRNPNVAYDLTKSGPTKTDTAATRQAVEQYIKTVLGNSVKLKFADMSHAGEFERMRLNDIIRLSTTALDPMSTAHHEALHAFFAQLRDAKANDIIAVLDKAASSETVIRQLNELYKGNEPVLAQLKDPEERVAYMYQHWAKGDLTIGFQPRTALGRVADFIRGVLGIWSNDQRALAILEHFNSGEYAASGRDVAATQRQYIQGGRNQALEAAKSFAAPLTRLADAVVSTGSGRLRDTGIPSIIRVADLVKRDHTDGRGGDQGFIPAARLEAAKRSTALAGALKDFSQDELHEAMEALQRGRDYSGVNGAQIRRAQAIIKNTLADTRRYLVAAGVDINDLGPDYFPRVWDSHYISKNQQAFKDMLEPYIRRGEFKGSADDLVRDLAARDGNEFGVDRKKLDFDEIKARPPGMQFKKARTLGFITPLDAAPFVTKDLLGTLTTYINQSARKAEWSRRLGNGKLEALFEQAAAEGATPDQLKLTDTYLRGVDGTLGDSINPHARRIMGNMIVYQNIRLLPFAVFSSIIDPMGVLVRGASVRDAFETFKRGISEIPKGLGRKSKDDRATEIAELVGVIDSAVLAGSLGDIYTQGMVGGFAKKANTLFFKFNLMEGLNRSFRIGASEAAIKFITRHADGKDSKHSQRWINELGLQAGDIIPTADGRIALTTSEGLSVDQERRVHAAINQWVDGAVLRPDAADKPIWFNDPWWALVSHLKQFVYSFQKTILERVVHEYKQGNHTPAMALASYVPMMMAADFVKGLIQGGGEQPEWKKGWGMVDYTSYATQRAGLFGVGQFGLDAAKNVREGGIGAGALVGPTIEQLGDAVQLLGGHKQFGATVLNALPANALYKHAFDQSAPDPPA